MPLAEPPFDRAIALGCTMATLSVEPLPWPVQWPPFAGSTFMSGVAATHHTVFRSGFCCWKQPAAATQTLADVVVRVRCKACRGRPRAVYLAEDARGPGPLSGGVEPGWSVLLQGVTPRAE